MVDLESRFIQSIVDDYGRDLRGIVTYDEGDLDFLFLRDDVREDYSIEEFHRIFDDIILQGLQKEHFESLFHVGSLETSGFVFRDAIIFLFPIDDVSGLVISLERDAEFDVNALVTETVESITDTDSG